MSSLRCSPSSPAGASGPLSIVPTAAPDGVVLAPGPAALGVPLMGFSEAKPPDPSSSPGLPFVGSPNPFLESPGCTPGFDLD